MYDLLGGGFHRYSVDRRWLVPHFEKMLYDNAQLAVAYLHGWQVTGQRALPRRRRADARLHAPRARARGRRLRLGPGRRHRRRGGADVHLDAARRRARRAAATLRARPLRPPGRARRGDARAALRAPRAAAEAGARRQGDRLVERPRARRARRMRRACSTGRTGSAAARRSASSCSARSRPPTGASTAPGATAARRAPATSRTTPTSRTASSSCTPRPASCAGSRRRTGSPGSRSSSSATSSAAASSRRRPTAKSSSCAARSFDDHPSPSGNSMLAYVLLRLARIYGDDELEAQAVSVFRLTLGGARARAVGVRLGARRARPATSPQPRELAIVGPPDAPVARAALARFDPHAVIAFGPADGDPASRGEDARRRQARGLRLRAVRLPGAGDRPALTLPLDGPDARVGKRREQRLDPRSRTRRAGSPPRTRPGRSGAATRRRSSAARVSCPSGGMPPIANPVASRASSAVAGRALDRRDPPVARAEHHRRRALDDEDERLDDLAELAAARGRRLGCRPGRVGQHLHLDRRARGRRGAPEPSPRSDASAPA